MSGPRVDGLGLGDGDGCVVVRGDGAVVGSAEWLLLASGVAWCLCRVVATIVVAVVVGAGRWCFGRAVVVAEVLLTGAGTGEKCAVSAVCGRVNATTAAPPMAPPSRLTTRTHASLPWGVSIQPGMATEDALGRRSRDRSGTRIGDPAGTLIREREGSRRRDQLGTCTREPLSSTVMCVAEYVAFEVIRPTRG